jgi:hypothetical protein
LSLSTTALCRSLLASSLYTHTHAETVSDEHPHAMLALSHACQCGHQPLLTLLHGFLSKDNVGHVSLRSAHSFHMSCSLTQHSMKAWAKTLDPSGSSGVSSSRITLQPSSSPCSLHQIRFLADPSLAFTKGLDLNFDAASIFGGDRSKRYALVIEDGAVKAAHVESDNTGLNGTIALVPPQNPTNNEYSLCRRQGLVDDCKITMFLSNPLKMLPGWPLSAQRHSEKYWIPNRNFGLLV